MWQDTFNLNAEDLSGMLSEVLQGTGSLIDTDVVQPLYALAAYAKMSRTRFVKCSMICSKRMKEI